MGLAAVPKDVSLGDHILSTFLTLLTYIDIPTIALVHPAKKGTNLRETRVRVFDHGQLLTFSLWCAIQERWRLTFFFGAWMELKNSELNTFSYALNHSMIDDYRELDACVRSGGWRWGIEGVLGRQGVWLQHFYDRGGGEHPEHDVLVGRSLVFLCE